MAWRRPVAASDGLLVLGSAQIPAGELSGLLQFSGFPLQNSNVLAQLASNTLAQLWRSQRLASYFSGKLDGKRITLVRSSKKTDDDQEIWNLLQDEIRPSASQSIEGNRGRP